MTTNRPRSLKAILTATIAITLLLPAAAARHTQPTPLQPTPIVGSVDWPMFHFDSSHTGIAPGSAPDTNNLLWNYTAGGQILASPAIVGDKLYAASYDDHKIFCLNESNGRLVWNYTTDAAITYSSPAVSKNRVYIGSTDNHVYCFNATSGVKYWSTPTGGMVYSSPTVVNNRVYIGSSDNKLYCLDGTTGDKLWNYTTSGFIWSSPAVADDKVFIGSMDFKMYCLNASTGAPLWNYTTGMIIYSSPVIAYGNVYFGSWDHNVYCLNEDTGALVWKHDIGSGIMGAIFSTPAVTAGKVYIGVDWNPIGGFFCFNATNGAVLWNKTLGGAVYASPAVGDGKVYVGTCQDTTLYCFNMDTGAQLWTFKGNGYFASSPALSHDKVYIGCNDNHLYCIGPELVMDDIIDGAFTVFAKVTNNGPRNLTLNYSITFSGGFMLLGKQNTGKATILPYDYGYIRSSLILGFGKPTITFKYGPIQKTVNAQVFLFFVKILP